MRLEINSERPEICAQRTLLSAGRASVNAWRAVLNAGNPALCTEKDSALLTPPREVHMLCWLAFGEHEASGLRIP